MSDIKCRRCNQDKPKEEFSLRKDKKPQSWCKSCARKYRKEKYLLDKVTKQKINKQAKEFAGNFKCIKCGFSDPRALVWSKQPTGLTWEEAYKELTTANLLCANCWIIREEENG